MVNNISHPCGMLTHKPLELENLITDRTDTRPRPCLLSLLLTLAYANIPLILTLKPILVAGCSLVRYHKGEVAESPGRTAVQNVDHDMCDRPFSSYHLNAIAALVGRCTLLKSKLVVTGGQIVPKANRVIDRITRVEMVSCSQTFPSVAR